VSHLYLAIEGAIGVGKTTLARLLQKQFQCEILLEVFEENPFLSDFYSDRARYAFQTQIFFLLSRYRQQHHVIAQTLRHSSLISDYTFAKDRLFAHLNLSGDELAMYERVHDILASNIPVPDLVIYLRASTDTLMQRIAIRDRPYERGMDRAYIDELRRAYERFFGGEYTEAPVLPLDTDELDYVRNPEALAQVVGCIRAVLQEGIYQRPLPEVPAGEPLSVSPPEEAELLQTRRRLGDFQRWYRKLDQRPGAMTDPFFNYLTLAERVGALGAELRAIWTLQEQIQAQVGNRQEAQDRAMQSHREQLQADLADCLASLLKLANYAGVDLEEACLKRSSLI